MTDKNIPSIKSSTFPQPLNHIASPYRNLLEPFATQQTFSAHIVSDENIPVMQAIEDLKTKPPLTAHKSAFSGDKPVEERLFDARANVKIMTSEVSMHINPGLREKLFHQIDMLHDPDEWEDDDIPVNNASFKAFLSGFLQINPERGPGLGLSHTGNLIASWLSDRDRLIIEFMPNQVKWVITRFINDEPEQFTGRTKINRLFESLAPYNPEHWFSK